MAPPFIHCWSLSGTPIGGSEHADHVPRAGAPEATHFVNRLEAMAGITPAGVSAREGAAARGR